MSSEQPKRTRLRGDAADAMAPVEVSVDRKSRFLEIVRCSSGYTTKVEIQNQLAALCNRSATPAWTTISILDILKVQNKLNLPVSLGISSKEACRLMKRSVFRLCLLET